MVGDGKPASLGRQLLLLLDEAFDSLLASEAIRVRQPVYSRSSFAVAEVRVEMAS